TLLIALARFSDGLLELFLHEAIYQPARALGRGQRVRAPEGAPARADVEAPVLLAAAAQRAAREVPRQPEDPHAILGADGTGPAQVPVDQGPQLRIRHLGDGGRGE